ILVNRADDETDLPAQPRETIDDAVDDSRVEAKDCARCIHRAPRDGPTVKLVNPVFVVTRVVKRAQSLRPNAGERRAPNVEESTEQHADSGNNERNDNKQPLGCELAMSRAFDR